jgi:hypothetical protein
MVMLQHFQFVLPVSTDLVQMKISNSMACLSLIGALKEQ